MNKTLNHFLVTAKAYVALAGSVATALLGIFAADTQVGKVLTIVAAVATAVSTWATPNADQYQPQPDGPQDQ